MFIMMMVKAESISHKGLKCFRSLCLKSRTKNWTLAALKMYAQTLPGVYDSVFSTVHKEAQQVICCLVNSDSRARWEEWIVVSV